MKILRFTLAIVTVIGFISPTAVRADSPIGISTQLWQAYQDVAIKPASQFPYQAVINTSVDQNPRNDKWFAAPNVIVTGAPNAQDLKSLKDFTATVAQSCTGMTPTYQTQVQTTVTVARRGRVSTITTTTPDTYLMNFYYVPTAGFVKVSSALASDSATATDAAIFTYDSAGNIYGTKTLLSTDQATQAERDLAMKRYFLQALGLFGTTSDKSANAFLASDTSWDGNLSDFDRELIALHCSTSMPSYKTSSEIASAISGEVSARHVVTPTDAYKITGNASETSASFTISAPSIDHQILQKVEQINYSVVDDSGSILDSGVFVVGDELFHGSWTLNYSDLKPFTTYTITVSPQNSAGKGTTNSYDQFTWDYGNL